jgi:hypothetical protein
MSELVQGAEMAGSPHELRMLGYAQFMVGAILRDGSRVLLELNGGWVGPTHGTPYDFTHGKWRPSLASEHSSRGAPPRRKALRHLSQREVIRSPDAKGRSPRTRAHPERACLPGARQRREGKVIARDREPIPFPPFDAVLL